MWKFILYSDKATRTKQWWCFSYFYSTVRWCWYSVLEVIHHLPSFCIIVQAINNHPILTRSKTRSTCTSYQALLFTSTILKEPKSVFVALQIFEWKQAMTTEYQTLLRNNTWELVSYKEGIHVVRCKWVFKTKLNSYSTLQKYKARLVAKFSKPSALITLKHFHQL